MRSPRRAALAAGLLAVSTIAVGCGDQEDAGADVELSSSLDIAGVEMAFLPEEAAVLAGRIPVTFRNEGAIYHDLRIEDHWDIIFEAGAGATDSGEIMLEPGTYTMFCSIAGHREGGMEGKLYVRERT
jgi:plastocyanin